MANHTLVVNFFGGPGSGKSTLSAALFAELKTRGINAELVTEYAKDKVWEESLAVLDDEIYIFAKQFHRISRLLEKVDVVITDSPILLSLHYAERESETFKQLVREEHSKMRTLNIFLLRVKRYEPKGRIQNNEAEAKVIDTSILQILKREEIPFIEVVGDTSSIPAIAEKLFTERLL